MTGYYFDQVKLSPTIDVTVGIRLENKPQLVEACIVIALKLGNL